MLGRRSVLGVSSHGHSFGIHVEDELCLYSLDMPVPSCERNAQCYEGLNLPESGLVHFDEADHLAELNPVFHEVGPAFDGLIFEVL